eukprot:TRINITY_DN1609_c3_g1_i1.p1 TRINITY_DN1609_c3_g1~~TRINITY_DN1609_c3_g1_i1.p1  ORF type:complete len:799 (+),score=83.44 TRINITY_DN1609_c3_g1_i1:112-2508(+)
MSQTETDVEEQSPVPDPESTLLDKSGKGFAKDTAARAIDYAAAEGAMEEMSDAGGASTAAEDDGMPTVPLHSAGNDVNPLEEQDGVWRRFREQYNNCDRGTLGPLRLEDVEEHRPPQPTTRMGRLRQVLTRSGRRERNRARTEENIYRTLPGLTAVMVVRIQRTWRGYITRRSINLVRATGSGISDLESKRVLQSAAHYGKMPIEDVDGIRHLPLSFYGASAIPNDTSVYRVRLAEFIWYFGVRHGGWSGIGLILLALWFSGTVGATYLIPGWAAMCLKTFFDDGESSLTIDQLISWVIMFSMLCCIGVGVLHMFLVFEQERFGQKLDFILALVGVKKSKLINQAQLHSLRSEDLGRTKKSIYKSAPLAALHGLHTFAGVITVLAFDWHLGLVNLVTLCIVIVMMSLYDKMVSNQQLIIREVAKREGVISYYHRKYAINDEEFTSRNYQLGLSKSIMRMHSSFGRVHGLIGCTALMLAVSSTVFFFYAGGKRVQRDHITTHTFVLAFCYYVFTMFSFFKFNENLVDFLLSKVNMRRVFKVVWHFRDFSDEAAFKERQCAIISQAEGMKEYRVQPRSVDLFVIIFFIAFIISMWLFYFGVDRGELECKSKPISCEYASDNGVNLKVDPINVNFEFSFFYACTPLLPRSIALRKCAYRILQNTSRQLLPIGAPYRARLTYQGWRDYPRGFSKVFETKIGVDGFTYACPTMNRSKIDIFDVQPFITEAHKVETWARAGVGYGEAEGVAFDDYREVFFGENNFRGCFANQPVPEGACKLSNPEVKCWCNMGQPANWNFTACN